MEPTAFATKVLDVVRLIPRGYVMSYGDVAEYLGEGGPRVVGTVLSRWGGEVPWHRVLLSDGRPAAHHVPEQLALLRRDGVPLVAGGARVDMRRARWDGSSAARRGRGATVRGE